MLESLLGDLLVNLGRYSEMDLAIESSGRCGGLLPRYMLSHARFRIGPVHLP
jgi:hypothetical protein